MTTTYVISFNLTTVAPEHEADAFAAELAEDARAHLRDRERLELAGVEPAPPERPPAAPDGRARAGGGQGREARQAPQAGANAALALPDWRPLASAPPLCDGIENGETPALAGASGVAGAGFEPGGLDAAVSSGGAAAVGSLNRRIAAMPFTLRNLREDLADVGSNFDGAPDLEFRLASKALELEQSGLSYQRIPPDYRFPYGHTHKEQEEVFVVVGGSGRMKLDDEIVEVKKWDVVRVPPGTWRGYEAGPEGLEILVFGAPNLGENPREDVEGQRDWWAD